MHRTRRSTGRKQYVTWTATDVTFPCRASSASCLKSCAEARSPCGTGESNSKAIDGWAGMARVVGSRCQVPAHVLWTGDGKSEVDSTRLVSSLPDKPRTITPFVQSAECRAGARVTEPDSYQRPCGTATSPARLLWLQLKATTLRGPSGAPPPQCSRE